MAVVWKARQLSLDRIVAIKVLGSHLSADAEDVERFKVEAQAEAKLKHPGIVQVYDANVEAGFCYIVQEYVDGYSVEDWVQRKGHLSEEDALLVAGYVADALAYAWESAGVIHCDIKPDNILIDADGTPKVTDLGLARTIIAMTEDSVSNEVMGTLAYMSPEQIQGLPDIDCRTDIYSLGAMLYHCVTGKMLFEGSSEDAVMQKQLYEQAPAPQEINPEVSDAVCGLIEKLLAKDRSDRYSDWAAVQTDIILAKTRRPPREPIKQPGLSTVRHTAMPLVVSATRRRPALHVEKRKSRFLPYLATLLAAVGGVMAGMWGYAKLMQRVEPDVPASVVENAAADGGAVRKADQMLGAAREWHAAHPNEFRGAMERYRRVMMVHAGSPSAQCAADELRGLRAEREAAVQDVMDALDRKAGRREAQGQLMEAAEVYAAYTDRLAVATAAMRATRADDLRARHADAEQKQRMVQVERRQWMKTVLDDVAAVLLDDGMDAAQRIVAGARSNAHDDAQGAPLAELDDVLADAADPEAEIIESFVAQVGDIVDVAFKSGTRTVKIVGAVDNVVHARLLTSVDRASVELQIRPGDLAAGERLQRMGNEDEPDVALAKGLMAWRASAFDYARRYFGRTHSTIADRLVAAVNQRAVMASEAEAESALAALLRSLGVRVDDPYNKQVVLVQLQSFPVHSADSDQIEMAVARYRQQHGETAFARDNASVLDAVLTAVGMAERKQRRYGTGIGVNTALTVATVQDALLAANPDMARHEIVGEASDDGRIVAMQISSRHLRDLSPVGACCDLVDLSLASPGLQDLTGIAELPLTSLSILDSDVMSVGALKYLPLEKLKIHNAPLRDLAPLSGTALKELSLAGTRVSDLRVLKGMPLETLDISATAVKRLDFLRGMPLQKLNLTGLKIRRLDVVRSMPVRHLEAGQTLLSDLAFVAGSEIEHLNVEATRVRFLAGLRVSKVRWLNIGGSRVRSLNGLQGLALEHLDISHTAISDITPLQDMPLRSLTIDGARLTNLEVLRDLPLIHLSCRNLRNEDYAALRGLHVQSIDIANLAMVRDILLTMPNLNEVNGVPLKGDHAARDNRRPDR